jgi:ABC-type bacteriocin/lantibiotic exporter with double-glycine peptidase domain
MRHDSALVGFIFSNSVYLGIITGILSLNHVTFVFIQTTEEYSDEAVIVEDCSFAWELENSHRPIISNASEGNFCKPEKKSEEKINDVQFTQIQTMQEKSGKRAVLEDITLSVKKGEVIGIYGAVGSGKSSLLFGILGEMQVFIMLPTLSEKYFI